jgi:hypothetical protein
MAVGDYGHAANGSANVATVTLPADLVDQLEALPGGLMRDHEWTEQEDTILRLYWPIKRKTSVAKILGMAPETCRKRYLELVGKD